jgi:hypothetical protein
MPSSELSRRVALVTTDISEELSASIIRVTRIRERGTTLAVTINRCLPVLVFVFLHSVHLLVVTANIVPISPILVTLKMDALGSSETSVLT